MHDTLEHPGRGVDVALARFPHATEADAERAAALVGVWERSPLAARVAGLEARREVPFLVEAGGAQIAGRLDLLARDGTTGLVIDYKSNRVTDSTPAEMRDAGYALQEAVYALALLEHGHEEVEVHFAFLDADEAVMRRFTKADVDELRERVAAAVAAATTGPYAPRPGSSARIAPCSGCSAPGPTSTPCMPRLTPTSPPASRARVIVRRLTEAYPEAVISLHYEDAWQLLVAVILSAQCTDARVNEVTPKLFARFPTPASVLDSTQEELEELIRPTGFFRNKSRSIRGAAEHLLMYHDGKVPRIDEGAREGAGRGPQDGGRRARRGLRHRRGHRGRHALRPALAAARARPTRPTRSRPSAS